VHVIIFRKCCKYHCYCTCFSWGLLVECMLRILPNPASCGVICGHGNHWAPFARCTKISTKSFPLMNLSDATKYNKTMKHTCSLTLPIESCLFLWLANTCLQSGHWPAEFKAYTTVVIPKPGKPLYDTPKSFCPLFF
jgi:hypothetical protein